MSKKIRKAIKAILLFTVVFVLFFLLLGPLGAWFAFVAGFIVSTFFTVFD